MLKNIIIVELTKYELRIIARNTGIKSYQSMSQEKLLDANLKYDCITKNLSQNGLEKIIGMQNHSLNNLEQIERMNNLSLNELKQIAKTRHIKTSRNTSKEDLLIALLKSNQSHTELRKSQDNNMEIGETKKLFNELRSNFSKEEIKKVRRKFRFRKSIIKYLKKLE